MDWRTWTYGKWNRHLIDHHFVATGSLLQEPVERIPATPEELVVIINESGASPSSVAAAFVECVLREVPFGEESFCGYCINYRGWNPRSADYPPFFGMLWFTCLVAYGYPRPEIAFYPRLHEALKKKDSLQYHFGDEWRSCLPVLWSDLKDWTINRRKRDANVRELLLPTDVGRRTAIGYSWFLAFPHQRDRLALAKCLWGGELVGPEPPIEPVVGLLQARRDQFSSEFREDLDDFVKNVLNDLGEARSSAFWRAVRQEALQPSVTSDGQRLESKLAPGIVVFESDEGLRPVLCAPSDWIAPDGYERHEMDESVGTLTHYFTASDGSLEEPAERALVLGELVGLAHQNLIRQGLLVLREVNADVCAVVTGTETNGASLALVRDELVELFCKEFKGRATRGLIDGWWEVTGCVVQRLTVLPREFGGVAQLLATMQSPTIGVAGGIRVPDGFYWFANYLPHVHAYGADRVVIITDSAPVPCIRLPEEGEWALPSASVPCSGSILVRAEWPQEKGSARTADARIKFVDYVIDDELKPVRAGTYVLEGCGSAEIEVTGGTSLPLDLMTCDENRSSDLLELDGTIRYLGPGLGEMSLQPTPGFDWMVVGPNHHPDLLVFVGKLDAPTAPANRRSPDSGDRRHWRQALGGTPAVVRLAPGQYVSLEGYPLLSEMRVAYARHSVSAEAPGCPVTNLKALEMPGASAGPAPITLEAINALTAMCARKGGLMYKDATVLVEPLVGARNATAVQQLLRAWAESGLLDIVRDSRSGRLIVVGRAPALVRVRRGLEVEATVFGLLSEHRERRLQEAVRTAGSSVRHIVLQPPNPYQPRVHRLRGTPNVLDRIAVQAGVDRGGWLEWPVLPGPPDVFSVQRAFQGLSDEEPPPSYKLNAVWDWGRLLFERRAGQSSGAGVEIQRRTHNDGTSIYTVQSEGRVVCRSYVRNWALLFGYEWSGRRPFRRDAYDALSCEGMSPLHLPLPIARLCSLTGAGLPGPKFADKKVLAYSYPFGRRLYRLMEKMIPAAWIS